MSGRCASAATGHPTIAPPKRGKKFASPHGHPRGGFGQVSAYGPIVNRIMRVKNREKALESLATSEKTTIVIERQPDAWFLAESYARTQPRAETVLPIPVYVPVPGWCRPPAYVAPPPNNVIFANVHNRVEINNTTNIVTITNPAGHTTTLSPPAPSSAPGGRVATPTAAPAIAPAAPKATFGHQNAIGRFGPEADMARVAICSLRTVRVDGEEIQAEGSSFHPYSNRSWRTWV
jgi:hypothetical protein